MNEIDIETLRTKITELHSRIPKEATGGYCGYLHASTGRLVMDLLKYLLSIDSGINKARGKHLLRRFGATLLRDGGGFCGYMASSLGDSLYSLLSDISKIVSLPGEKIVNSKFNFFSDKDSPKRLVIDLCWSIANNKAKVPTILAKIQKGDINGSDLDGVTPLCKAVSTGDLGLVERLIQDKGACVNSFGLNKMFPLHYAVLNDNEDMVNLLLREGANPVLDNSWGARNGTVSPFDYAITYSTLRICRFLANRIDFSRHESNDIESWSDLADEHGKEGLFRTDTSQGPVTSSGSPVGKSTSVTRYLQVFPDSLNRVNDRYGLRGTPEALQIEKVGEDLTST